MYTFNATFRVWLIVQLARRKMTQKDFAAYMGVTEVSISRWATGKRLPTPRQMQRILDYFDSHIEIVRNKK